MKKNWMRYVVVFGAAAFTGAALLQTSQDVQRAEGELRSVQNALESERESIRVLEAEWGYLNNPARLEGLASQYLDLVPPVAGSTVSTPASLPDPFVPVIPTIKPIRNAAPTMEPQPIAATSQAPEQTAAVIKPKSKPTRIPSPQPPAKEKLAAPAEKSFGDLLNQYGGGQ